MADFDPNAYDQMVNGAVPAASPSAGFDPDAYDAAVNGKSPAPASVATDNTKSFIGIHPESADPRSWFESFWNPSGNPAIPPARRPIEDPSPAKAMALPGQLLSTGVMDALKRISGNKPVTHEEYRQVLAGDGKGVPAHLQDMGVSPALSYVAGIPAQAVMDPLSSTWGGAMTEKQVPGVLQALSNQVASSIPFGTKVMNVLKNMVKQPTELSPTVGPISSGINSVGDAAFKNNKMVKMAEKELQKYRNAGEIDEGTAAAALKGLNLQGSNKDISDQIAQAPKDVGAKIGEVIKEAGGKDKFDLAPDLEKNAFLSHIADKGYSVDTLGKTVAEAGMPAEAQTSHAAASKWIETESDKAEEALSKLQKSAREIKKLKKPDADAVIGQHVQAAQARVDKLDKLGDIFATNPYDAVKQNLASDNPAQRAKGIAVLKQSMPGFNDAFDKAESYLMNSGTQPSVLHFLNGMVRDLKQGPRSLQEVGNWKTSLQNLAAGSLPMQSNFYARYALPDASDNVAMDLAGTVGTQMENTIANKVGDNPSLANYPELKRQYMILNRIAKPAGNAVNIAMTRPPMSKLDWAAGAAAPIAALIGGDPKLAGQIAVGEGITKSFAELHQNPSFAIKASKAIKKVGSTGLWDNMLRQKLLNSYNTENEK